MQQPVRMFQAYLLDHLARCQVEHALAVALQLRHGNPGDPRQFTQRDPPIEMRPDVLVHRRQPLIGRVGFAGGLQVDRDARQADDCSVAAVQRPFVGQAPTRLAGTVEVQFQLVFEDKSLLQHPPILLGIAGPQLRGKYLGAGFSQQRLQVLQAAPLHQGAVGQYVARLHVLDKDRGIGNHVQHRQQQPHAGQ